MGHKSLHSIVVVALALAVVPTAAFAEGAAYPQISRAERIIMPLVAQNEHLANSWRYQNGVPADGTLPVANPHVASLAEPVPAPALEQNLTAQPRQAQAGILAHDILNNALSILGVAPEDEFEMYTDFDTFSAGACVSDEAARGIDVSRWQGAMNWGKLKSENLIDYAIISCGYGDNDFSQDDPYFSPNVSACIENAIPFGVYLYSYATNTDMAASEAEHVIRMLRQKGLNSSADFDLPIYYDLEDDVQENLNPDQLYDLAATFANTLAAQGYGNVGVYANTNWWEGKLTHPGFEAWPRWVAQYNIDGLDYPAFRPAIDIWQFTSGGNLAGVGTRVDLNYAHVPGLAGPKIDIAPATLAEAIEPQVLSGSSAQPAVSLILNNNALVLNRDYTLAYENNNKEGIATAICSGIGRYTGTITFEFAVLEIRKTPVTLKIIESAGVEVSWNEVAGVSGYIIERARTTEEFQEIARTDKLSFNDTGAAEVGTYRYRVTPYKEYEGKTYVCPDALTKTVKVKEPLSLPAVPQSNVDTLLGGIAAYFAGR